MAEGKESNVVPIVIFIAFVLLFSIFLYLAIKSKNTTYINNDLDLNFENEDTSMTSVQDFDEFSFEILTPGTGVEAVPGNIVSVNYEGTLIDGTEFDSSYGRGIPFEFTLGQGRVIEGWEKGVLGMKVGEVRRLKIPSSFGYGENGAGATIPGGAGLIFKVELLEIK